MRVCVCTQWHTQALRNWSSTRTRIRVVIAKTPDARLALESSLFSSQLKEEPSLNGDEPYDVLTDQAFLAFQQQQLLRYT